MLYETKDGNNNLNTSENTTVENNTIFYHYNNLGSTTKFTNEQGEITEKYTYGTYGELLSGDTEKTEYLYNGMYGVRTDENGLYHMRARFYNTEIKRFINQDILRGDLTNSLSLNRYSYVQGNPVTLTDPFGLSPLKYFSGIGHTFLTLVGTECGIIGGMADLINGIWYMAEGESEMAALSFISAAPLAGNAVAGTLSMFKCAKAAKIVSTTTRVINNATTFTMASVGMVESSKVLYHNIKNGEIFTWENAFAVGSAIISGYTAVHTGKSLFSMGKSFASNVAKKWSGVKRSSNTELPLKYDLQYFASKPTKGSVTYRELDSLGRATEIEATITQDMIGTGSPAKASIKPAGFGGQAQGHARGHLFGNQLGGSGSDPRNLVTIYQNPVNHPVMSSIEANVRKAVEGGQIVKYRVKPIYEGNNLIPSGITIQAQGNDGFNIYQTILNRK